MLFEPNLNYLYIYYFVEKKKVIPIIKIGIWAGVCKLLQTLFLSNY